MSRRIIQCQVSDEYVLGSGAVAGAAGSHDDVALRLAFGPMWEGTARSIMWKDALGGNPTITILGTDLLEEGETEVYIVPIPAEPKAYAGNLSMTIKGAVVDGETEASATLTARAFFSVMESDWDENAEQSGDVPASQAEQLQHQLEEIKSDILEVSTAVGQIEEQAAAADAAALAAASSATDAAASATAASGYANEAAESEENAEYWARQAQAVAGGDFATHEEAEGYATNAVNSHNEDQSAHESLLAGKAPAVHTHGAGDIASGILPAERGGTGAASLSALMTAINNRAGVVSADDTDYTTLMARGMSLHASETTPAVNGAICWTYA